MCRKVARVARGFSALEVIFAVMLLGVGFYGFLTLFSTMTRDTINDEYTLVASKLADEKIEQLVASKASSGYASLSTGTVNENISYGVQSFTRQTVTNWVDTADLETVSGSDTGFKRIDVTVSWNDGSVQNVSVATLVTDY